ncbi:MAG: RND transporter, partial [Gammaproteobacteria bacterium]
MGKRWGEWVIRFRWPIVLIMPILMLAFAYGASKLSWRTDYRAFFSPQNPELQAFEKMQRIFNKSDSLVFVVAPASGTVFDRDTLKAIEELTDGGWQLHLSTRVDSLRNYQHTTAVGDDLEVRDLYEDPENLSDAELLKIKQIALNEPLIVRRLVSDKGDVAAVNVTFELPDNPANEIPTIAKQARELAHKVEQAHPGLKIHMTGVVMMNAAFREASEHDFKTLVPIMFAVVVVMLWLTTRIHFGVVTTVLVIAFSIAAAMGLAGWLGFYMTGPTASAPIIILTMGVADAVHLLIGYLHFLQQGLRRKAAMIESVRVNFQPVLLTSVTTVVGFLSMNFSEVPPFRDLGNIVAFGVGFAWLLTTTFLPALMVMLPIRVPKIHPDDSPLMERVADFVIRHRTALLWGVTGLVLASLAGIPKNELDDQFVQYFDKSVPFRQATDFANERLAGIYTIEYALDSGQKGGISEPKFLQEVDAFVEWARQQKEVR